MYFEVRKTQPKIAVDSKVWKMFDVLRKEKVAPDKRQVLLFLLLIFRDGLLSNDLIENKQNFSEKLLEQLRTSNNSLYNRYAPIVPSFEPLVQELKTETLQQLLSVFSELSEQELKNDFSKIFDEILYQISQAQKRIMGDFIQPVELTRFMCNLADTKPQDKVFNPFAGIASFGVYLDQKQDYYGQELYPETWVLGALRIMAYNRQGDSRYVCEDSILHWPSPFQKFDLIISSIPANTSISSSYNDYNFLEPFIIEKGLQSLSEKGKLIVLFSPNFHLKIPLSIKNYLIDEDLIEMIIAFPNGLLFNSTIPTTILVLNKDKQLSGKIKFVNAAKFITGTPREKILDDTLLNNFIQNNEADEDTIRVVSNDAVRKNKYDLDIAKYFQKHIEGKKLSSLLTRVAGRNHDIPKGTGKVINTQYLINHTTDSILDTSNIQETELRQYDQLISVSCLLLPNVFRRLHLSFFEFKGESFFISGNINAYTINEAIVDKDYLINELKADYVQEQLRTFVMLRKGLEGYFSLRDLMDVVIKIPSFEVQRAKVQGAYEQTEKFKKLQEEHNAHAYDEAKLRFNEFASLKHTLGRPRQSILDWSSNLLYFFNENKEAFEALNKKFEEDHYGTDAVKALTEIKRDIDFITEVLEKGEGGLVLSNYKKEIIPLSEINEIINELSITKAKFQIKKLYLKEKEGGVYMNKVLFKTLLDNILTNANKYAFDRKEVGNEVVIELSKTEGMLFLEIKDNGKGFPKNFNKEKFITKFNTADSNKGKGLGGYDIHRIASDFKNPDWILSLNEDPLYLVKFLFKFPIESIK